MAHAQPSTPQPSTSSLTPPPLRQHIRLMCLTFTQLSTLQRQEIYSASGLGWSRASTWAGPHDDPVAQPFNEAAKGEKQSGGRRDGCLDSPVHFLWQISKDVRGEDNKRCASRSTLKRLAKLITQFHLSHSAMNSASETARGEEEEFARRHKCC